MFDLIRRIDGRIIVAARQLRMPVARVALFVVYVWFGVLKVIGESPASPLVAALQEKTLPFFGSATFLILFGLWEMLIGATFLVPRAHRIALGFLAAHMVMTMLPLLLVPDVVWTGFLIPTLEGQYIIKNIALIAVAVGIAAHLEPLAPRERS